MTRMAEDEGAARWALRSARAWLPRHHPSDLELGAWFDRADGVGDAVPAHVVSCLRCSRKVQELRRVRAFLHGEPLPPPPARARPAWAWSVAPLAVVATVAVLAVGPAQLSEPFPAGWRRLPSPVGDGDHPSEGAGSASPSRPAVPGTTGSHAPRRPSTTSVSGFPSVDNSPVAETPPSGPASGAPRAGSGGPPLPPGSQAPAVAALRLGAVTGSPDVPGDEAAEIAAALQMAVHLANETGGVGGRPVKLVVARADDPAAVNRMLRSVDVLVGGGGIGAPSQLSWLFPADPALSGDHVVAAEWPAVDAGRSLAQDLDSREIPGPVGVVVGDGPGAGLADGLAQVRPVVRASLAPGGGCSDAVTALRRRAVVALALAGSPDLVRRCADAAAALMWRPPGGLLVPPSAAYAHLERAPELQGARTVLGMPWPSSEAPGAGRYRAAVPEGRSYRALVSFAAVELAVQISRAGGSLDDAGIRSADWRSDLFDVRQGRQRAPSVVVATLGSWWPKASAHPAGAGAAEPAAG